MRKSKRFWIAAEILATLVIVALVMFLSVAALALH